MSVFRVSPAWAAVSAVTALLLGLAGAAHAASWRSVVIGKTETIDIDMARIQHGGDGTTGWSRILLGREVKDPRGTYNEIHAQNLYDCDGRRFTTLRRAYFRGDTLVREEPATRQRPNRAQAGSIDERLLNEACRGRWTAQPGEAADRMTPTTQDQDRPGAMHADMRTLGEEGRMRAVPVADAAPKTISPPPAAMPEPAPAAPPPGTEKPRHILLPPIDKAAAAQAAASVGLKQAPPAPVSTAPAAAKPGALSATAAAASAAAATSAESADERRARELQLATSGPRRVARKKAATGAGHAAANPAAAMHQHWAYEGEGAPANWAKLRGDYATCATGQRQSPIDIRDGIKVSLETIRFDYRPSQFRIVDNGHTLQVTLGEGLAMHVMGKRYELIQFHFHRPAEERVNGKLYDMVVHLVHRNDEGQLAVIAVLLEKGSEHPLVQTLWNNMPLERDMDVSPAEPIDVMQLLPENRAYWTYMGSLTTPPCTEGVLWMVMKQPVQVSADQIAIFSRLYRNNARPVQPLNGRLIKESR